MLALEMHPPTIHLILVVVSAIGVHVLGHHRDAGVTPLVRFWENTLPGIPVPEVISDLVQKGIDHSPLAEHYPVDNGAGDIFFETNYQLAAGDIKRWQRCRHCAEEPKGGFYFRQTQVRVGSAMTFSFRPALVAPILPHDVAEKVPFDDLANVLATFGIAPSSAEAATVRDTLSQCQAPPHDGERRACATSLEGTVQSAMHMLGGGGGTDDDGAPTTLWAAASALRTTGLPLQPYVIQAVIPLDGDRHVGCHIMPYPYAVYYCHMTPAMATKAYLVSLSSVRGGPAVTMAAICHLDTSNWLAAHPAFAMLHTQPGGVPVCHFMSYGNLLFGEKAVAATC